MKALTKRQSEILQYIIDFIEKVGYPPTYREIGNNFGFNSTNGVFCHLNLIERKGYIARDGKSGSRAIAVLKDVDGKKPLLRFCSDHIVDASKMVWTKEAPTECGYYFVMDYYGVANIVHLPPCSEWPSSVIGRVYMWYRKPIEFPPLPEEE